MISKAELKKLLSQGKTQLVIEHLINLQTVDSSLKDAITMVSYQFHHLKNEYHKGVVSQADYRREGNQIIERIIIIIEGLDEVTGTERWKLTENQKKAAARGLGAVGAIALIANLSQISGCNIKDALGCHNLPLPANSNVTVFVHGKNGKHDLILRQKGHVFLDVPNGDRKDELIDDKGAASFKNVKVGDKVIMNVDLEEPYRAVKPDSIYIIPANGNLYLEVSLQNQEKVYGQVTYKEMPLANVKVAVDTLNVKTDSLGNYRLFIPMHLRLEKHPILFLKDGFKMGRKSIGQQANTPIDMVMEREKNRI